MKTRNPTIFSEPIEQYISHRNWKQICFLKLGHLLEFSNNNSRINWKICSKLATEAPDVVLVSLLLTFDIFGMLFQ